MRHRAASFLVPVFAAVSSSTPNLFSVHHFLIALLVALSCGICNGAEPLPAQQGWLDARGRYAGDIPVVLESMGSSTSQYGGIIELCSRRCKSIMMWGYLITMASRTCRGTFFERLAPESTLARASKYSHHAGNALMMMTLKAPLHLH